MVANVLVSIDRTSLSLPPLEVSGEDDARVLGLTSYQEPGLIWRVQYMPDHPDVHGSEPLSASLQQGIISFGLLPNVADEAALRAALIEFEQAVSRFSYEVTTTVGNAAPRVWRAHVGSVQPDARTFENLLGTDPVAGVTIPVYPIAS